jgi:hypothetical protein
MKLIAGSSNFYTVADDIPILHLTNSLVTSDIYTFGKHEFFKIRIEKENIQKIGSIEKKIKDLLNKNITTQLYLVQSHGFITIKIPKCKDKIDIINNDKLNTIYNITKDVVIDIKITFDRIWEYKDKIHYKWNICEIAFR